MQTHEIEEQGSVCLNEKVKISKTMQPSPKQNYKEVECIPNQFKKRQYRCANLSDALAVLSEIKKIKFQYKYSKTFKFGTQEFACYSQAKKYK